MEFIKAEEFLKQPVEVQKVFIDWWKPSIGEMMYSTGITSGECIYIEDYKESGCEIFRLKSKGKALASKNIFIPLFTEGQLRQFIEDKTSSIIDVEHHWKEYGYSIYLYQCEDLIDSFNGLEDDLLQAYWKVAIEIAKE